MRGEALVRSFKYRSGAAALRSLSEETVYFASPTELNDSLEAKFDMVGTTQFIDVLAEAFLEIARQRGINRYSFDHSGFKEIDLNHTEESKRFQEASRKVGIFSTTARPDNQPMWAYYCENSAGVCFELEWSDELFREHQLWVSSVRYTTEARLHNRADDLRKLLLELSVQHPDWTVAQIKEFSLTESFRRRWGIESLARAVSQKHADWQHESELRILAPRSGPKRIIRDTLKQVFFVRTDFAEWGPIMKLLHMQYPDVKITKITFDHKDTYVTVQDFETQLVPLKPSGEG